MKTKTMMMALVAAAAIGASATAQAGGRWIDDRRANQIERIQEGIATGDLTRREARRLRRQQRRIARLEDRLAADGRLSRRDRARLDRAFDRASRRIARARHNHRTRYARHGGHTTVINNHYETAEPEVVETVQPSFNRSVELDLDGVRIIWSTAGFF